MKKYFCPLVSGFHKHEKEQRDALYFLYKGTGTQHSIYFPFLYKRDDFFELNKWIDNFVFSLWPLILLLILSFLFYLLPFYFPFLQKMAYWIDKFKGFLRIDLCPCHFFAFIAAKIRPFVPEDIPWNAFVYWLFLLILPILLRSMKWYRVNVEIDNGLSSHQTSVGENYERNAVLFLMRGSIFPEFFQRRRPYADRIVTLVQTKFSPSITPFNLKHFEQYLIAFCNQYAFFYVLMEDLPSFLLLFFIDPFLLFFSFYNPFIGARGVFSPFFVVHYCIVVVSFVLLVLLKIKSMKRRFLALKNLYYLTRRGTTFYQAPVPLEELVKYEGSLKELLKSIFF